MNNSKDSNSSGILKHQSTINSIETISTHRSELITSRTSISLKSSLDTNASSEIYSTVHQNLLDTLNKSTILSPLYTNVKNESYYYQQRKKLGPKKHMALIVKYSANKCEWESNIFKMKIRESDMEIVPQRSFIGYYKSKWNAYKHCELACKERDLNPAKNKKITNPDRIISTHFKITIVSDKFYRMKYIDRLCLVYQELLKSTLLGANIIQSNNNANTLIDTNNNESPGNHETTKVYNSLFNVIHDYSQFIYNNITYIIMLSELETK